MNQQEVPSPDSTDSYTVGWICALEEEYECACRMLDEEFPGPKMMEDNDDNTYVYGRIVKHYVVVGCLPAGRYGTNSAARVARDMVRTFPKLRFALMVGIGGGAPTTKNDIRLGDVVVSQPRDGFGGVIQYDLGKKLQDGRFQKTGQLNAPPEKLLGAIPEMRRFYNDKRKPDRIMEHLQRMNDMEDYQQPPFDRLYKANYQHVAGKSCDKCDPSQVVERPERQNNRIVHVHYGTIASGNSVLKDAIMRDAYAEDPELNVLCFEMEAAGLMNNLPCLVIRGICDYCDSHKNNDWHKYAALTAASYARELLLVLRPQRVDAMPSWASQIVHELQQVDQSITSMVDTQRTIRKTVESLDQKIGWGKLSTVKGAAFDSYENQHDECLRGTRVELLHEVEEWTISPHGKCIFWLNGMAGTGKSTISQTVARYLKEQGLLGASFFFKRGEGDRGNAKSLFPTLIEQLVTSMPQLIPTIENAIADDTNISEKALREQFERLLLQPLLEVRESRITTMVIVIDALDECDREDDIRVILKLLPQVQRSNSVKLRFLLTSRPELPIRLGFKGITNEHQDLILHQIPKSVIEQDISLYFQVKLSQLREERSFPPDWPGSERTKILIERAVPLFISAATICRFISDKKWNPEKRLQAIIADQTTYVSKMDSTYMTVLNQLLTGQDEWESQQLVQEFKEIVGVIILLATPLSVNAISRLLNRESDDINNRLDLLHSVLEIPKDLVTPVRLLHLSFRDFLLDSKKKDSCPFWIEEKAVHQTLTRQCLEVMEPSLKKNICNLAGDGTQRSEIDMHSINNYLPPELQYSCRYWTQHLVRSQDPATLLTIAFPFLRVHFLHWVEVLSILGMISEVMEAIKRLHSVIRNDKHSEILEFLNDARHFTLKNRQVADTAPLQLYSSSLMFSPRNSIIRGMFDHHLSEWHHLPKVQKTWSAEIQTLEGYSDSVNSITFSPDGQLLASGSSDRTIRLWDPTTGQLQQTLEGHSNSVKSITFSPDGQLLASGSNDRTIRLWDPITGQLQQTLEGHSNSVQFITFSPDSQLLASYSDDGIIKLWDLTIGQMQHTLEGHSGSVQSITFSPDGQLLASGSSDRTIRLWDPTTGELQHTLQSHSNSVRSITFSPDSQLLASSSGDKTIKLWASTTGQLQQTLKGHSGSVNSITFSPDGQLLASGSSDRTIRLWDPITGQLQQTLEKGYTCLIRSVIFSPDSQLLASNSDNGTIKLWDPNTGKLQQTLERHYFSLQSMITFSPDGQLLASSSDDRTIRLWDPTTGQQQQVHGGHSGSVWSVTFSPDSQLLASGSDDKTIKLWDPTTGQLQQTLEGHSGSVQSIIFSPDGQLLVSGSDDKTIKLWDPTTGQLQQTLKGHSGSVWSVTFSPDGQLLVSGSDDKTIKLWDPTTGQLQQTLKGHSGSVWSVTFSPDGQLLVSGSDDKTIKLWDPTTGQLQQILKGHSGSVWSVIFSPDGQLLASSSDDRTIKLWDPITNKLQQTLEGDFNLIWPITFSPDSQLLASSSDDGNIKLWDPIKNKLQWILKGHSSLVWSIIFSPDSQLLASGSADGIINLWDPTTGELQQTLERDYSSVSSITFSPNGQLLASGSDDRTIRLWDPTTDELQQTLEGHSASVQSITFSPDSLLLASGSADGIINLWDSTTGELQQTLEGHSDSVQSIIFSPDGQLLASGSDDGSIMLWDPTTGQLQHTLQSHSNSVRSITFSPDGQLLASSSDVLQQTFDSHSAIRHFTELLKFRFSYDIIELWNPTTGELQQTLKDSSGCLRSISFSPDGQLLASGSDDGIINLWDSTTGELQQTLEGHSDSVQSITFSPDGQLLASSSDDGSIMLWNPTTGQLQQTLKGHTDFAWLEANVMIPTLVDQWICLRGMRILWLPLEYRPYRLLFKDGIFALGLESGRVYCLTRHQ